MSKLQILLSLSFATLTSAVPIGYEVVEGGYYPVGAAGLGGFGLGGAGFSAGKYLGGGPLVAGGAGLIGGGAGFIGAPLTHGYGGEFIDKSIFGGGKKILNDAIYEKAAGNAGGEMNAGNVGFSKGIAAFRDNKGESGFYNDAAAAKKLAEDGKTYYGGHHFDKEGKHGGEISEKAGHKKGHSIKGFKTVHNKDESGKTEEYYDEANDEGAKVNYNGHAGSFGEKGASSFKGAHENGEFVEGGHKKQSHFDNEHLYDNSNAGEGNYGAKKYAGNGAIYGVNNGVDQHSLLGHQENSKIYKHIPHVPFY